MGWIAHSNNREFISKLPPFSALNRSWSCRWTMSNPGPGVPPWPGAPQETGKSLSQTLSEKGTTRANLTWGDLTPTQTAAVILHCMLPTRYTATTPAASNISESARPPIAVPAACLTAPKYTANVAIYPYPARATPTKRQPTTNLSVHEWRRSKLASGLPLRSRLAGASHVLLLRPNGERFSPVLSPNNCSCPCPRLPLLSSPAFVRGSRWHAIPCFAGSRPAYASLFPCHSTWDLAMATEIGDCLTHAPAPPN
ncbi:uncharacterized protein B0H64DRAFT_38336 [Chaetomium fimeti]|uniref:Uncharacterized protein n=1 Tax=Chaetomium fimeti TaxID=1854472 RepID=A0AAE0HRX8_9PEZI|nr:hypothetical protein B0H64DRAFT_38336 [Chaetomium fimeti]